MSFDNNFSQNEQFYEELIKRFFHQESYFYYCLKNSLSTEPSKKQIDKPTSEIISTLVEFLINSKDPLTEFKEISNTQRFNNFYEIITSQLAHTNLPNLDNKQTKNFIQNVALKTLENFIQVFSKENNRLVLRSYLDLKLKLKFLLNDSNGNDTKYGKNFIAGIESNGYLDWEKADLVDQTSILAEETTIRQQEELDSFQKFFEEDIRVTLKPIVEADAEQTSDPDFIIKCYDIFYNLIELGKFHNNNELVIISEKVLQLIKVVQKKEHSEIKSAIELILAGNSAIEHFVTSQHPPLELNKFLKKFDDFLQQLGINENDEFQLEADTAEQVSNNPILEDKENNLAVEDDSSTKQTKDKKSNAETDEIQYSEINFNEDIPQFTLPGEEDEDLMDLIQEISSSMAETSPEQKGNGSVSKNESANIETNYNSQKPGPHESFHKEAHLFIQVILNSIAKVDKKNEDSTYLDDIELASSSLKILAQKFEFRKIVILPELIESICINMKTIGKHLPHSILEKIKEGILLLQIFDQSNAEHESKLLGILISLKKYYSFTIKALENKIK
jgi:hypothetical protein